MARPEAQTDLGLQLPELTVDNFQRAWTRFELVAVAKDWDEAKRRTVVPTLLRGKLIDFYTELEEGTRNDLAALKAALQEKAGLKTDPLVASRNFNTRDQRPNEKVIDYATELKQLFKQAYPGEGVDSTVLLQRFLTGLRPSIARQMLLQKKPDNLKSAIEGAVTVEYALNFESTEAGRSSEPINLLHNKDSKHKDNQLQEEYVKLHKTVENLTKQMESLETALRKSQETPPAKPRYQVARQGQRGRRRDRGACHSCGEYGHFYRQCPLNYQGPTPMGGSRYHQYPLNYQGSAPTVESRWSRPPQ